MSPVIESQFFAPRLPVNIVALPNAYEAHAMRSLIEMLGGVEERYREARAERR